MEIFGFHQMQRIQKELQESCVVERESNCPQKGQNKMLWMLGEVAEVTDMIRTHGDMRIMEDAEVRKQFVEEVYDVLKYVNEMIAYYDITPQELQEVHAKMQANV